MLEDSHQSSVVQRYLLRTNIPTDTVYVYSGEYI